MHNYKLLIQKCTGGSTFGHRKNHICRLFAAIDMKFEWCLVQGMSYPYREFLIKQHIDAYMLFGQKGPHI